MDLSNFASRRFDPDGTEGTATATIYEENIENPELRISGCIVKNDADLMPVIGEHIADRENLKNTKYWFYSRSCVPGIEVEETTVTCHRFSNQKEPKSCELNPSPDNFIKLIPLKLNHLSSNVYGIDAEGYQKLGDAGPVLLQDKKTIVGSFKKEGNNQISISVFEKNQDERDAGQATDASTHDHGDSLGSRDQTHFPTEEQDERDTGQATDASTPDHGDSFGSRDQTNFPIEEQGTRYSMTPREQPDLPNGYDLSDVIRKDELKYRRCLLYLAKHLTGDQWKKLGGSLNGVEYHDLEHIMADNSSNKERAYQMLVKWLDSSPQPTTLKTLLNALRRIGQLKLVDNIPDVLRENDQVPIENPITCTEEQLNVIASQIHDEWRFIGRYLGLTECTIHDAIQNNTTNELAGLEMLIKWSQCNGRDATVQVLARALRDGGKEAVARNLKVWPD